MQKEKLIMIDHLIVLLPKSGDASVLRLVDDS